MLPVFTAAEMRELDARAIASLGIPGPRLMEAAGTGAARLIAERWRPLRGRSVVILCGRGTTGATASWWPAGFAPLAPGCAFSSSAGDPRCAGTPPTP